MSIKQEIKFKEKINFEEDQQDLVDKTASIQSLADQIQMLEGLNSRIETSENKTLSNYGRNSHGRWLRFI